MKAKNASCAVRFPVATLTLMPLIASGKNSGEKFRRGKSRAQIGSCLRGVSIGTPTPWPEPRAAPVARPGGAAGASLPSGGEALGPTVARFVSRAPRRALPGVQERHPDARSVTPSVGGRPLAACEAGAQCGGPLNAACSPQNAPQTRTAARSEAIFGARALGASAKWSAG